MLELQVLHSCGWVTQLRDLAWPHEFTVIGGVHRCSNAN